MIISAGFITYLLSSVLIIYTLHKISPKVKKVFF